VPGAYGDIRTFPGLVDEVAVYNRALTGGEIQGVYQFGGANKGGTLIQGNTIGLNAAGSAALANGGTGVTISGSAGNVVGGTTAGNLISGNTGSGIRLSSSAGANNQIQGNVIGLSDAGTVLGSANGVFVNGGPGTLIGGTNSQARNVISGNTTGISLSTSGT